MTGNHFLNVPLKGRIVLCPERPSRLIGFVSALGLFLARRVYMAFKVLTTQISDGDNVIH